MQMNQNGRTVLERRYLVKDEHGENIETVEGLFRRVADAIAEADRDFDPKADVEGLSDRFYDMMTNLEDVYKRQGAGLLPRGGGGHQPPQQNRARHLPRPRLPCRPQAQPDPQGGAHRDPLHYAGG